MTDEIAQLLRNLHLKKIAAIVDDELAHAEKHQLSYGAFLAPGSLTAGEISALPAVAATVALLFGHLTLASSLPRARVAAISLAIVGGLIGIGALAASSDGDDEIVSRPDFVVELKPLRASVIPTQDTAAFFAGIAKLRETVDSLAAIKD